MTNITSEEKMIEELNNCGIEVRPVMKAIVPNDFGMPGRKDIYYEEISIEDAHRKYCASWRKNYDPFSDNPLSKI